MGKLNASIASAMNRSLVLTHIRESPGLSRVELASLTGLARSTVTELVYDLVAAGLVEESHSRATGRPASGRPRTGLKVIADSRMQVVVTLDVQRATAVLINLGNQLVRKVRVEIRRGEGLTELIDRMLGELKGLAPAEFNRVVQVGVSSPGIVDPHAGVVVSMAHNGWQQVALRDHLANRWRVPSLVINNAKAAAVGELDLVAEQGIPPSLIYLYIREATDGHVTSPLLVGGGVILGGELWHGANRQAGEISNDITPRFLSAVRTLMESEPEIAGLSLEGFIELAETNSHYAGALAILTEAIGRELGVLATFLDPAAVLLNFHPMQVGRILMPQIAAHFSANHRALIGRAPKLLLAPKGEIAQFDGLLRLMNDQIFVTQPSGISLLFREEPQPDYAGKCR